MKTHVLWFGMTLFALVVAPLAGGGARTGRVRPFKAKSIVFITEDRGPDYDVVMYGQATHLGTFAGEFLGIQYFPEGPDGPANVGHGTLTAANDDTVTIAMVDCPYYMDDYIAVAQGTYDITGGTGRFSNASGQGTYIGIIDLTGNNPPEFTFDGTVVY